MPASASLYGPADHPAGPIVKTLLGIADLMDADAARQGHRYDSHSPQEACYYALLVAYGVTSREEWEAKDHRHRAISHQARMTWRNVFRPIWRETEKLLAPHGAHSDRLTAADVRAIADKLQAEAGARP